MEAKLLIGPIVGFVVSYLWLRRRIRKAHEERVARGMEERKAKDPKERIKRAIYNPREHRSKRKW